MLFDMEARIHLLEREAYFSILRAFKSQSDVITWEKESLITDLRKELRVSDEEHREIISQVNSDDFIRMTRDWRNVDGLQHGPCSTNPSSELVPNHMTLESRKKQRISNSVAFKSDGPSPTFHTPTLSSSFPPKESVLLGVRGRKLESNMMLQHPISRSPSTGFNRVSRVARSSFNAIDVPGNVAEAGRNPLIGKKVWTRWPEDDKFYEAVITDYNPVKGLHALVYDINTNGETWEWVNLREISPEDIRWANDAARTSHTGGHGELGSGFKKAVSNGGGGMTPQRDRSFMRAPVMKDLLPSQNERMKKPSPKIELLHTDTLIMEVEKMIGSGCLDPGELERLKTLLKDHEQSLLGAIRRLEPEPDN